MNKTKFKNMSKVIHVITSYYRLTKPGVLYGNVFSALAGFLFASQGNVNFSLLVAAIGGTALVIASACVVNNYLDQDIDKLMTRTKKRPLITGEISPTGALIFGVVLCILGFIILQLYTNILVVTIGVVGFIYYVLLYGAYSKRRSVHGTLVGSISGAAPILAGYVAVAGIIDIQAFLLFIILFIWQLPEFYSIAIYRLEEYKKAGVPVITVVKGVPHTKKLIAYYVLLFVAATSALWIFGTTSTSYFIIMMVLGIYWIVLAVRGMGIAQSNSWARQMFRFSLIILVAFCALISVDNLLP